MRAPGGSMNGSASSQSSGAASAATTAWCTGLAARGGRHVHHRASRGAVEPITKLCWQDVKQWPLPIRKEWREGRREPVHGRSGEERQGWTAARLSSAPVDGHHALALGVRAVLPAAVGASDLQRASQLVYR